MLTCTVHWLNVCLVFQSMGDIVVGLPALTIIILFPQHPLHSDERVCFLLSTRTKEQTRKVLYVTDTDSNVRIQEDWILEEINLMVPHGCSNITTAQFPTGESLSKCALVYVSLWRINATLIGFNDCFWLCNVTCLQQISTLSSPSIGLHPSFF